MHERFTNRPTWRAKRANMMGVIWKFCLRYLVLAFLLGSTAQFVLVTAAVADPYEWCAQFNISGGTNCGFVTYEQCRAAISGLGGICQPNPYYTGPENQPTQRDRRYPDR